MLRPKGARRHAKRSWACRLVGEVALQLGSAAVKSVRSCRWPRVEMAYQHVPEGEARGVARAGRAIFPRAHRGALQPHGLVQAATRARRGRARRRRTATCHCPESLQERCSLPTEGSSLRFASVNEIASFPKLRFRV